MHFHPKTSISTKNKNFSIEEYVLIELRISIHLISFLSLFEVFMLLLGVKVMAFVLHPLFRFRKLWEIGMQQNHLLLKMLLGDQCQIN